MEEEEAEAMNPKIVRKPVAPTKAMVMAHEVHHADYREWCAHCVAGKGVCHQHRSSDREDRSTAEFSVDYAFMTSDGQMGTPEELGESKMAGASPVAVVLDHQ